MGGILSAGPYPDNPLVGNRPMKYPYTLPAQIAQFPLVHQWKYTHLRYLIYGYIFIVFPVMYKIEKLSKTPSNVEEWKERRKQWYSVKHPPEYDCY